MPQTKRASKKAAKKSQPKNDALLNAGTVIKAHPLYIFILLSWGMYVYFLFHSPSTSNQLHITEPTLSLLRLSVAIPYLLIWLSAAYAYIKIKRYALGIRPSLESSAFERIANGMLLLLSSLLLSTFFSSLRTFFSLSPETRAALTILTNYAYVFPFLLAFILLFKGTAELTRQYTNSKIPSSMLVFFGVPLVFFTYLWLEVIFTNQTRVTPGPASLFATYYLRDSLLILTIVIPSLITWVLAILTVIKLRMYFKKVKGILYKRALSLLVNGLISVILGSIFLQALNALGSQRLIVLGLGKLLVLIYLFLFIQALGYLFIARGANKLTKIESV